ncbi:MAG: flagellar biosynthetic protein FliO [Gammaproteobacteria bacterium]|nr:flagellar biosynthetic protein FliO [Gammaproteobacteria bacterium]
MVANVLPYESVYRLVGSFILVLLLMFAVAYVVKRFNPVSANMHKKFKVVSVLPFGSKQKAVLVQIGDEQILLGISQDRINTLHRLKKPIEADQPEISSKPEKSLS